MSEATRLGVVIRVGSTVTKFDFETPALEISHGETFQADAILGADGLRSKCREALLGRPDPPYFTGEMGYRLTVSTDQIEQHEEIIDLVKGSDLHVWMGPNAHAVGYQLKKGGLFNLFVSSPDDLPIGLNVVKAETGELKNILKDWDPRLKQLVDMTKEVLKWRLQDSHGTETWCHSKGKVALLGDACHASLPYL